MEDTRRVQIKDADLNWHDMEFTDLKDGDIFRMFESTGEPVIGLNDTTEWTVNGDVYSDWGTFVVNIR